jgi:hypothetical protein
MKTKNINLPLSDVTHVVIHDEGNGEWTIDGEDAAGNYTAATWTNCDGEECGPLSLDEAVAEARKFIADWELPAALPIYLRVSDGVTMMVCPDPVNS